MSYQDLSFEDAVEQLVLARREILELQDRIVQIYDDIQKYRKKETKIPFHVDFLMYQTEFLHENGELFGHIVIKNNKIIRVQAASE
jgi:hypothetical protein